MKRLLGLLLVMGMVGCGGGGKAPPAGEAALPQPPNSSQAKADEPPAQAVGADPSVESGIAPPDTIDDAPAQIADAASVAALEKRGAKIERNSEGDEPVSKEDAQAKAALRAGDTFTPADLVVRLSDDFEKDYPAPHHFDMTRWTKWKGDARTQNGQSVLTPTPPGSLGFAGIGTRKKDFNRGLAGTNGVEVTLAGYASGEGGSEELDKPEEMRLDLAWALTLGSWHGQIGGQPDKQKDRGVQLHLDLIRPNGLYVYLVRGLLPEDNEKYPKDGYSPGGPPGDPRASHEEAVEKGEVFISAPCLCLATRVYRSEQEIQEILGHSHRWGLYLTDDANTVYWTLDAKVMDRVDIAGYFNSSPESVRDGAHLTVSALGAKSCTIDDLVIYASPAEKAP